jgi:hypothetical protein
MKDQTFEELAKLYPDLFQKARVEYFECGDGWYTILRSLCSLMSHDVQQARYRIKYHTDAGKHDKSQEEEEKLSIALEALPVIAQVKEKFGGLRFYVDGGTDEIHNNEGWIKTMCTPCHKKAYPDAYSSGPKSSKKGAKLSDET